jgi:hypothetical protein
MTTGAVCHASEREEGVALVGTTCSYTASEKYALKKASAVAVAAASADFASAVAGMSHASSSNNILFFLSTSQKENQKFLGRISRFLLLYTS